MDSLQKQAPAVHAERPPGCMLRSLRVHLAFQRLDHQLDMGKPLPQCIICRLDCLQGTLQNNVIKESS
jgi:hypothetical protein